MGRRAAREMAMKLLYQMEIQKDDIEGQLGLFFEQNSFSENDSAYIKDIVYGVYDNSKFITDTIEKHSLCCKIS